MKKKIILAVMLLSLVGTGYAQDSGSQGGDQPASYAPMAGDISAAIIFGRYNFISSGLTVPNIANTSWYVPGTAPNADFISPYSNDITNMVGAEGRYFFASNIAIKLSGGAAFRHTPAVINVPGYIDSNTPNSSWIPYYQAVIQDDQADVNVNLGGEYHFSTEVPRLFPWVGLTVPFYYARRSQLDPTIGGLFDNIPPDAPEYIADVGVRHVEITGFGAQAVAGVDYYLGENIYLAFEIKPVSYIYLGSRKYPAPGLDPLNSENTNLSFFAQPFMKIGFRF